MKKIEKTIVSLEERNEARIDRMFGKHVGFDMDHIPERMKKRVEETRRIAFERFRVRGMYLSEPLASCDERQVVTESGAVFKSKLLTKVLKDAEAIVCLATTLEGLEEVAEEFPKATDQLYYDGWATAILESANLGLREQLKQMLKEQGLYTTGTWSPGQHGFDIYNQEPIFSVLHPEDIGIRLNDSFLMIPQKSETQLFGICRGEQKDSPVPCDYCDKRETCPDAYSEAVYMGGMS